ncbi:MAG: hypothetical protein QM681_13155 [Novosphingobium sp.]
MNSKPKNDWWRLIDNPTTDQSLPGIYEWRIADRAIYIGKSKRLPKRIREYPNNVRKMLAGLPYRKGKQVAYRVVHHALKSAYDEQAVVTVTILQNCDLSELNELERRWIARRRRELEGTSMELLNAP